MIMRKNEIERFDPFAKWRLGDSSRMGELKRALRKQDEAAARAKRCRKYRRKIHHCRVRWYWWMASSKLTLHMMGHDTSGL